MKRLINIFIFLFWTIICQANTLIDTLDKNAVLWNDWNIKNVKTRRYDGPAILIISKVKEQLQNIIKNPSSFDELKNTISRKLKDYPQNPKGKYYSNKGFNVYFIIYNNLIAYFFSFQDKVFNWTRYNDIEIIYHTTLSNIILSLGDEAFQPTHFSPVNIDVFINSGSLYLVDWVGPDRNNSRFLLSKIRKGIIEKINSHGFQGYFLSSYDFDRRIILTREWENAIKQDWHHGATAVYDNKYEINNNIKKVNKKCLNPWYLVVKKYIEAIWEDNLNQAKEFITDRDILKRTKNFKYLNSKKSIYGVKDDNWLPKNIKKEIKTIYLEYMDEKYNIFYHEIFYLKEFNGEWKISDIKNKYFK